MDGQQQSSERPIDRALRWAKELGMGESAFAKALDVSPQRVTNWKRRGMPASFHPKAAKAIHHSIQELLGEAPSSESAASPWPFSISRRRFDLLSDHQKKIIEVVMERLVLDAELRSIGVDLKEVEASADGRSSRRKHRAA